VRVNAGANVWNPVRRRVGCAKRVAEGHIRLSVVRQHRAAYDQNNTPRY